MNPDQLDTEITLRTIAAAWKCTYDTAPADAPYSGLLSRGGKVYAVIYIERSRFSAKVVELPETLDVISLQRGNTLALETGIAAVYAVQTPTTIAALVRKGEPLNYGYEIEEGRLVAVIPQEQWRILPLPPGTHFTRRAGAAG